MRDYPETGDALLPTSQLSGPVDEAVLERLKAKARHSLDEGENPMHGVRYPFVR